MSQTDAVVDRLTPIDEVARQLGLSASAIRYYEQRNLVMPAQRHAGRRWYGPAEIRQLAIIRFWQVKGLMSLDEIAEIIDGSAAAQRWPDLLKARIDALAASVSRLQQAKEFLEHVATHHADTPPDGCAHYENLLFRDGGGRG